MEESGIASPTAPVPQPRAKSCVECRQHKIRCDRVDRHPNKCTRCTRRNLPCEYLAQFTRVQKRQRTLSSREDGRGPEQSRGADSSRSPEQETFVPDGSTSDPHGLQHRRAPSSLSSTSTPSTVQVNYVQKHLNVVTSPEMSPTSCYKSYVGQAVHIGDTTLTSEEINMHTQYFFTKMHPLFPFLEQPFDMQRTHASSPFLFWSIIAVASSFRHRPLYENLQQHIRRLFSSLLFPFKPTHEIVQALCLLSCWPFDAVEPGDDPLLAYMGMAINMATHLGLHRPQHIHEFRGIQKLKSGVMKPPRDRLSTWLACIFLEHQLATKTGVPSATRDSWAIQQSILGNIAYDPPLPTLICHHVELVSIRERHINALAWDGATLSGLVEPKARMSIIRLFHNELEAFAVRNPQLDVMTAILLHTSVVTMAGFCLASDIICIDSLASERTQLLRAGSVSAIAVMDTAAPTAWEALPVYALRAILIAGIYAAQLMRFEIGLHKARLQMHHYHAVQSDGQSLVALSSVLSQEEKKSLIGVIDRATDLLGTIGFGYDFATRGKVILEALRKQLLLSPSIRQNATGSLSPDLVNHAAGLHAAYPGDVSSDDVGKMAGGAFSAPGKIDERSGVLYEGRMGANLFWDAVEQEKQRHNWAQNSKDILKEIQFGMLMHGLV